MNGTDDSNEEQIAVDDGPNESDIFLSPLLPT